jgi:hypothetical protein
MFINKTIKIRELKCTGNVQNMSGGNIVGGVTVFKRSHTRVVYL